MRKKALFNNHHMLLPKSDIPFTFEGIPDSLGIPVSSVVSPKSPKEKSERERAKEEEKKKRKKNGNLIFFCWNYFVSLLGRLLTVGPADDSATDPQ